MTTRTVFLALALFTLSPAFAAEDMAAHKQEALSEIDQRIAKLQEHKACVSAAETKDAMMQCRHAMKEWHKGERAEHLERRKGRLDKKIQNLKGGKPAAGQ